MTRARGPSTTLGTGMTLVELLVAMSLAIFLVATAAFVFAESQKIMSKVDARLRGAQSFRVTSTVLDQDGARLEPLVSWNAAGTALQLRQLSAGGPWFQLTLGTGATPDVRQDTARFVTHASLSLLGPNNAVLPPADKTVLVTYRIRPNRGLVRELDPLDVTTGANGLIVGTLNDAALPNSQAGATGPLVTDLAPGATAFNVRYFQGGSWNPPDAQGGPSDTGQRFFTPAAQLMPSGLEFTVFIPESTTTADAPRLSLVRAVELFAPPP